MNNDDWEADNESDIDLYNGIEAPESPEPQVVGSARNVPGLIRPTWRSMQQPRKGLMIVTATETRRNTGDQPM